MGGIDFQGLNQDAVTPSLSTGKATTTPLLEQAALLSRVAWRYENAERSSRLGRVGNLVIDTLDQKITALETAANAFEWPVSGSTFAGARLITPANSDSAVSGLLSHSITATSDNQRFYKYFSRGRSALTDTDLDGEDYAFTVTHGGTTETVEISVDSGASWSDILTQVADGINSVSMPVQAEVINQSYPNQQVDSLYKTGAILGISINPTHADQTVELKDTDGYLLKNLDLEATTPSLEPATKQLINVSSGSALSPSTWTSALLNPIADHGLEPGDYKLALTVDGVTQYVSVGVTADMDSAGLLSATAQAINAAGPEFSARVVEGEMSSGQLAPVMQQGNYLEVSLTSPKLGQRLSVSGYGGPWQDEVDERFDPTVALPGWVTGGERFIATATANGWTSGRIYEYDGSAWVETAPMAGSSVYSVADDAEYFFESGAWSTTPGTGLAGTLGLKTSAPGADAQAVISGQAMTSETGTFALDQGRVTVSTESMFGTNIPLTVVEGMTELQDRFSDVIHAYNDLNGFVHENSDLFEDGFVQSWSDPVDDLKVDLNWMGVTQGAGIGDLWVNADDFWSALGQDQDRARATIAAPDGLIGQMQQMAETSRQPTLSARLVNPASLQDPGPSPATEMRLEKQTMLQQVISAATDAPRPEQSPYVEFTNLLSDIIKTKREALSLDQSLSETGNILTNDI